MHSQQNEPEPRVANDEAQHESPFTKLPQPPQSHIKRVLAVMSGKGGVGKSTVSALTAIALARAGQKVGILDADITGPSIPRLFGIHTEPVAMPVGLVPPETGLGIRVMSINLLLPNEDDPVVWRGPVIAGAVKQFWTDVVWGDLDFLLIDLPPGTGDAPLTVMQSLPVDSLLVVTSPQELAAMVVRKAVKMAGMLEMPIAGLIENMSYITCPDCGRRIDLFGRGRGQEMAAELGLNFLGALPLDPGMTALADAGRLEEYRSELAASVAEGLMRA